MKFLQTIFFLIAALAIQGCDFFQKKETNAERGDAIARVYDRFLYEKDLVEILPEDLNENDSLVFVQNYINIWAKDQLMIYKAEFNLDSDKKDFEKKIADYRNDLLKFAYRQEFIRQNLDTNLADSALQNYYNKGNNSFLLKENIVRARYAILSKEAPDLDQARRWMRSSRPADADKFRDFVLRYAYKFSLNDSSWIDFESLQSILPLKVTDQATFLRSTTQWQNSDSLNVYFLKIEEYKLRGEQAPLAYATPVIKNILLNKKKLKLLENLEQNLLDDALEKKGFEVY